MRQGAIVRAIIRSGEKKAERERKNKTKQNRTVGRARARSKDLRKERKCKWGEQTSEMSRALQSGRTSEMVGSRWSKP